METSVQIIVYFRVFVKNDKVGYSLVQISSETELIDLLVKKAIL